jgi:hypothetical protein
MRVGRTLLSERQNMERRKQREGMAGEKNFVQGNRERRRIEEISDWRLAVRENKRPMAQLSEDVFVVLLLKINCDFSKSYLYVTIWISYLQSRMCHLLNNLREYFCYFSTVAISGYLIFCSATSLATSSISLNVILLFKKSSTRYSYLKFDSVLKVC